MRKYGWLVFGVVLGCGDGGSGAHSVDGGADGPFTGDQTVVLTVRDRPTDPDVRFFAAYQDGDGPWTIAPTPVGTDYTLTIRSGRYSALFACRDQFSGGPVGLVNLYHATVAETRHFTISTPCPEFGPTLSENINITISNLGAGETAGVRSNIGLTNGTRAFSLPVDLKEVIATVLKEPFPAPEAVARLQIVRNIVVAPGAAIAIDLAPATAITPVYVDANLALEPGEVAGVEVMLQTKTDADYLSRTFDAPFLFATIPATQLDPTDVVQTVAYTSTGASARRLTQWRSNPATTTFVFPQPLEGVSTTVLATTPFVQLRTVWTPLPRAQLYFWTASTSNPLTIEWTATATAGWLANEGAYEMPDPSELAALPGWDASFQIAPGRKVHVVTHAHESNTGLASMLIPDHEYVRQADGTVIGRSTDFDSITP